jgi:hypothetical protein
MAAGWLSPHSSKLPRLIGFRAGVDDSQCAAEFLGRRYDPLRVRPAPNLQRFVVTFTDWTAYRLEIEAESAEQAIELAQAMPTGDLGDQRQGSWQTSSFADRSVIVT